MSCLCFSQGEAERCGCRNRDDIAAGVADVSAGQDEDDDPLPGVDVRAPAVLRRLALPPDE